MKKNKIIIFTFAFIIIIISFSFYLLFQNSITNETSLNHEIVKDKPLARQDPLESEISVPKIVETQTKIVKDIKPDLKVINEESPPQKVILTKEEIQDTLIDRNLHQPIFDHLIVRSRAKAFFILQDAKGKLLEPYIVKEIRIWRKIRGDLWIEDEAIFNHETSTIECDGFGRQGIEHGSYSAFVDGGGYGVLEFNFTINKNEKYQTQYIMPYYAKTVPVHFVDREGKSVEYISGRPHYKWEDNAKSANEFHSKNSLVLRSYSSETDKNSSLLSGAVANDSKQATLNITRQVPYETTEELTYQTNLGKIYLRVFSGPAGEIQYNFNGLGSASPFLLKSNFVDIDEVRILCQSLTDLNSKTKSIVYDKNENTAALGVNVNKIMLPIEDSISTAIDYKLKGFNYRLLNSKHPLYLEFQNGLGLSKTKKESGFEFQLIFPFEEIEDAISVRLVDKKIFRTPWEEIKLQRGMMIYREGRFPVQKFKITFASSPTLFEMAKDFAEVNFFNGNFKLSSTKENLYFDSFYIEHPNLLKFNLSGLNINIISKMSNFLTATRDQKRIHKFLPKGFIYKDSISSCFQTPLIINPEEIIKSVSKSIEIAPFENTLILRAINYNLSGTPWVEATLIKNNELLIALAVKRILSNPTNFDFLKSLTDKDLNVLPKLPMDKEISRKLNQIFPVKKELEYFLLNGSWYNSNARSFSDSAGYLILKSDELIPGKKYTLFLWGGSQDDMKPNKEISFIAQKGITDLGAIKFD